MIGLLTRRTMFRASARKAPAWKSIHQAADRRVSRVEKIFLRSVELARADLDAAQVARAFQSRHPKELESALYRTMATMSAHLGSGRLRDSLFETLSSAGNAAAKTVRSRKSFRSAKTIQDLHFDTTFPAAEQWARDHAAELIAGVSDETRSAVRVIIERSFSEGWPEGKAARMIRSLIGLTERQAEAVASLRETMLSSPGKKIWAGNVAIRIPEEGASDELIATRMEQYSARLLNQRARMIARTETMSAANEGQRMLWEQALEDGLLEGDELREWIVTPDDRLCPDCEELDGATAELDGEFAPGVDGPPLHPDCRCAQGLSMKKSSRAAGGPGSGNFGHAGRPGEVGGSGEGGFVSPQGKALSVSTDYQNRSYELNDALRSGNVPSEAKTLDKAIALNEVKESVLYRGIIARDASRFGFVEGDDIQDLAFLSTSKSEAAALEFVTSMTDAPPAIIHIHVPKGTRGLDMNRMMKENEFDNPYSEQEEVVLGRGHHMHVDRIDSSGPHTVIHVTLRNRR